MEIMVKRNLKSRDGNRCHDSLKRLCICTDTWRVAVHLQKKATMVLHEVHVAKLQATNVHQ